MSAVEAGADGTSDEQPDRRISEIMSAVDTQAGTSVGTWVIDPSHTTVEFAVKHMMITTVKGRFGEVEGKVVGTAEGGWDADVKISAASIDTAAQQRDDHLRSSDFLDVENHPHLNFRSRGVNGSFGKPGDRFTVVGDLTIRGTTRQVEFDTTYEGSGRDPWGGERMSFTATTKIDRRDFGLTWNQALETGGMLVGNEVKINLDVQLVKQD